MDDACVGILRPDSKMSVCPPQREDAKRGRLMWFFQHEEAIRCVATGLMVLNISLLDQEQT